jgi:hypothetical protein
MLKGWHQAYRNVPVILFLFVIVCGNAWARDEFDGIKCGADIPKSLIGKRSQNEPVVMLETRHKDLGLKDLGAEEISDRLFLVSWLICGSRYEVLVNTKSNVVRDVLPIPPHSAISPEFIGPCQLDGKGIPEEVVAVLDNSAGYNAQDAKLAETMLKASAAWKIDETEERFVKQSTENLGCPLGYVVTLDRGH